MPVALDPVCGRSVHSLRKAAMHKHTAYATVPNCIRNCHPANGVKSLDDHAPSRLLREMHISLSSRAHRSVILRAMEESG